MFDHLPLPLQWPVYVSHAEASAYARWAGKALPTEAQWQRAAYGVITSYSIHYTKLYEWENERGERLLSLVDHTMLPRILQRLLDEAEFLSPYGVRSVSKLHATHRELGHLPGVGSYNFV